MRLNIHRLQNSLRVVENLGNFEILKLQLFVVFIVAMLEYLWYIV